MPTVDGEDVELLTQSEHEGVEVYRKENGSLVLSTQAVRDGEAEGIHVTYQELASLLVDVRTEIHAEDDSE